MYLIPRLIGVSTYTLLIIINYFLIRRTNAKTKHVLALYAGAIFIMGFLYVPNPEADLTRLIPIMRYYSTFSISQICETMKQYSTPGEPLYYYLISKLGNDSLLPALTGLITYGLCFSVLYKCSRTVKSSNYDIGLALFVFMSRGLLVHVISGIRNELAFAIIFWCVYLELIEEKKVSRHIPLYLIAASLHTMGQVFLLYRLLFLFVEKNEAKPLSKIWKIIIGTVSISLVYIIGRGYLEGISRKASNYYSRAVLGTGYSYIWEKLLSVIALLITIYLTVIIRRMVKSRESFVDNSFQVRIRNLLAFTIPIIIVDAIAFFVEFNFFHRTSNFLTMLDIPLSIIALKMADSYGNKKRLTQTLIVASTVMLLMACARGNLCSLKFFE